MSVWTVVTNTLPRNTVCFIFRKDKLFKNNTWKCQHFPLLLDINLSSNAPIYTILSLPGLQRKIIDVASICVPLCYHV